MSQDPPRVVAYLGPRGTFTEQAVLSDPALAAAEHDLRRSMIDVIGAVEEGVADHGLVPIENAIEGTVTATIDALAFDSELMVQKEIVIPITLELFGRPGAELANIETIVSHPHGNAQCRRWMRANVPNAITQAANSTADAVRRLAEDGDDQTAAIGNALAGELYGLEPLANDIGDHKGNETRFVLLAAGKIPAPTGHDKTSVVIYQRADRPGSLLSILQEFAARSINLTKLESRPTKAGLGQYCFVADLEGHISDELVADALKNIRAKHENVKLLGSYPAAGAQGAQARADASAAWADAEAWLERLRSRQAVDNG